jgi:Phage terminase large subunit (GpA)
MKQIRSPKRISPKNLSKVSDLADRQRQVFTDSLGDDRRRAIARWYEHGGRFFVSWVESYYKMADGSKVSWQQPFMPEFYFLVGVPWINTLIVDKSAQLGFTECMVALMAFAISEIKVPCAYGFEAEGKLRDIVNPRIQPAFDYTEPIRKLRQERFEATRRKDTDFQQRKITAGGVELTLFYVSTVGQKGKAEAPSSMRSFPCWIGAGDEVELWSPKALTIFSARFQATQLPSKPLRLGSTPGFEGGIIDILVKQSGKVFEWNVVCPHCKKEQVLHPLGNLLKLSSSGSSDGVEKLVYFDNTGKPVSWFCDRNSSTLEQRINSAYIGCKHCGKSLGKKTLSLGKFKDATGLTVLEFDKQLRLTKKPFRSPVAIRLPTLASLNFDPVEIIQNLHQAIDPTDIYQQGLGIAVSIGGGKIELSAVLDCVGKTYPAIAHSQNQTLETHTFDPDAEPDFVVMGVDQGKAHHWVVIQHWYLGEDSKLPWDQRWKQAIKLNVWYGRSPGFDGLDELCDRFGVHLIGFDGEPEYEKASEFAANHVIDDDPIYSMGRVKGQAFRFDQVRLKGEKVKQTTQLVSGEHVPVFAIHRTFGLDAVRNRFYRGLCGLPGGLAYRAGDPENEIYHYLSSSRLNSGSWDKPDSAPDHWFHADNFGEMAVYSAGFYEPVSSGGLAFGSI